MIPRLIISFSITLLVSLLVGCQTQLSPNRNKATSMPNTQVIHFSSQKMGEYKITLHWPDGAAPKQGWPIIYLLDGDSYFSSAASILTAQSCERCVIQNGVVVAIDYVGKSRRAYDYLMKPDTLTLEILPDKKVNFPEAYGGADDFFTFIEQELKPEIEKKWAINPHQQTIFGHSYGGLFVLHAFLTHPHIFTTYIASSPSLWFSGRYLFNELKPFIQQNKTVNNPVNLLISVGGNEQSLIAAEKKLPEAKQKMLLTHRQNRRMIDDSARLFEILKQADIKNVNVNYTIYANQTHQTAPLIALQDGIQVGFARE